VLNAAFTLQVPTTKAALVFEAERFSYWKGTYPNVSRDRVEYVSGLFEEWVGTPGSYSKVLYANSQSAADQANTIADSLLLAQYIYFAGGYKLNWNPKNPSWSFGTMLTSIVDRVDVELGPNGLIGVTDFTTERLRDYFEPERELERRSVQNTLYPGQQELRSKAEDQKRLTAVVRATPRYLFGLFQKLLRGEVDENLHPTKFLNAPAAYANGPTPAGVMAAGTPVFKSPTQAVAVPPSLLTADTTVFVGVTVRDGEDNLKPFYVAQSGQVLARVKGPVAVNGSIGPALYTDHADYLIAGGNLGVALQAIADTTVQLIPVTLGSGGAGGGAGGNVWL
jgi:hypothetical protein